MKLYLAAIIIGFVMDLCFGDSHRIYHPVQAMGWLITKLEKLFRKVFKKTPQGEWAAGLCMSIGVLLITGLTVKAVLTAAKMIHPVCCLAAESIICYQMLAARSLRDESMKVYKALAAGDTGKAREAVSMIVGRDTDRLSEEGITKAAVETIAENTSDGVIAPLLFMFIGGAAGAAMYKAINTMDSMVGYKNEKYLYFGRTAARLDDMMNIIPARLSAVFMIAAAFLLKMNYKNAVKIYKRDRYNHKSPNSAHTEAVCAGALGVELAGNAYYFGVLHEKPTIGDKLREIEIEDIRKADRLMYMTSFLAVIICLIITVLLTGGL